jgi:DNA (cytosine-5)-methyltransferase 1
MKRVQTAATRRPVAVDLFCGAGGLSLGLQAAGFHVAAGLDSNKHALQTYALNHKSKAIFCDVRTISGKQLLEQASVSHVDLLAGGPSCQGFSTHGKRLADDARNLLYREFMRLVSEIRPSTVLMENVKGLLLSRGGEYRDQVVSGFNKLGYRVVVGVLMAADFGVPQLRERIFFLASRLGSEIPLPQPQFAPPDSLLVRAGQVAEYRTVHDAISDLPAKGSQNHLMPIRYRKTPRNEYQALMRQGSDEIWNHVAKPVSPLARSIIERLNQGQGLRAIPPKDLPARFQIMRRISNGQLRRDCTTLYHRLSEDRPSYTITCYFTNVSAGAFTHPAENRAITPREAARLQSFPDRFRFYGSQIPMQIGNAVPPLLAEAVGRSIYRHIKRHGAEVA